MKLLASLFRFILRVREQPRRLPEPCPICRRPMKREGFVRFCPEGHKFRDRRPRPYKEPLLNEGNHTNGEI